MRGVLMIMATFGLNALSIALPEGYRVEVIASAPTESRFQIAKVNNRGNVLFTQTGRYGATFFDPSRGFSTFYGNEYGVGTNITGFNDNDLVTGSTAVANSALTALDTGFVWDPDQGFLQTFTNTESQYQGITVDAINNSGQLAISKVMAQYPFYYLRYAGHGSLHDSAITMVPSITSNNPVGVGEGGRMKMNNHGEIIGSTVNDGSCLYYKVGDTSVRQVRNIYSGINPLNGVALKDINDAGLIFGRVNNGLAGSARRTSSVIWNRDRQVIFQLEGNSAEPIRFIDAIDTDNSALVTDVWIGSSSFGQYGVWNQLGGLVPISSLLDASAEGFTDFNLQEMNNSYQIVGVAKKNGMSHLIRLDPVPEPATILALSAGMAGVVARRRKRS